MGRSGLCGRCVVWCPSLCSFTMARSMMRSERTLVPVDSMSKKARGWLVFRGIIGGSVNGRVGKGKRGLTAARAGSRLAQIPFANECIRHVQAIRLIPMCCYYGPQPTVWKSSDRSESLGCDFYD